MTDFVYHAKCECGEYLRKKANKVQRVRAFKMHCQFCKKDLEVHPQYFESEKETETIVHLRYILKP